jgi:hypothetical protein
MKTTSISFYSNPYNINGIFILNKNILEIKKKTKREKKNEDSKIRRKKNPIHMKMKFKPTNIKL